MYYNKVTVITAIVLLIVLACNNNNRQKESDQKQLNSEASFEWPEGKKMAITLTFDDARLTQIDKGIPLLDKYNVKGTFYVSHENMFKRMDKWREAVSNGHEVGNHTLTHPCTGNYALSDGIDLESYNLDLMREDMEAAGRIIRDSLGIDAISFAYPCGQTFVGNGLNTQSYIPLVASMFNTGRSWKDEGSNDPKLCDMSHLMGIELDGKSTREIIHLIESSKSTGNWLVLVGHEMNSRGYQTSHLSTLEAICRYAMDPANGVWIDNVNNISSYIMQQRAEMQTEKESTPLL